MRTDKEKDEKKAKAGSYVRILTGIIALILLLLLSGILRKQNNRFSYKEHLDEVLLQVEDDTMTLRLFGYYVYEAEAFTQEKALIYNRKDPLDFWNTHFSAGEDSSFVSEISRDSAIDRALGDMVYARMAKDAGFLLDEEKSKEAESEADEWYDGLLPDTRELLGISKEQTRELFKKNALAKAYAYEYSKEADLTGYSGKVTELLSGGGEYFNDKLLSRFSYKKNEDLIDKLRFGRITVNNRKEG